MQVDKHPDQPRLESLRPVCFSQHVQVGNSAIPPDSSHRTMIVITEGLELFALHRTEKVFAQPFSLLNGRLRHHRKTLWMFRCNHLRHVADRKYILKTIHVTEFIHNQEVHCATMIQPESHQ